jgi:hypothetical protein
MINVVWADDDSSRTLVPLARMLRRRPQMFLRTAQSYSAAMSVLQELHQQNSTERLSLLVDVILPHDDGEGALSTQLGVLLAERAVRFGVTRVVFLSVVPLDEVADKFDSLRQLHSNVQWAYFNKAHLLEPGEIDRLGEHLGCERRD